MIGGTNEVEKKGVGAVSANQDLHDQYGCKVDVVGTIFVDVDGLMMKGQQGRRRVSRSEAR